MQVKMGSLKYWAFGIFAAMILFFSYIAYTDADTVDVGLYPTTNYNCIVPTEREDNTAFDWATEGDVIRFYWGTATGDYQNTIERQNCQWIIDNTSFPANTTIYFTETAVDTDGRESRRNSEKTHTMLKAVADPKQVTGGTFEHIPAQ